MLEIPATSGYDVIEALIDAEHVARKSGDQARGDRLEQIRRSLERQMNSQAVANR